MPFQTQRKTSPFLALQEATFRLGDRLVFEKTNWRFNRNEQWAIIGPNGSGKSILADGLRGRLPLVQGELRYHFRPPSNFTHEEAIGHVAFEDRKSDLRGTVVQSRWTSFEEEASLSVRDFLSYDRVMEINPFEINPRHAVARQLFEARLGRAVVLFQLLGFLARSLLSLSNGERQRVQLARALAQPLRLLILDEPYIGLDRATRDCLHRVLERLLKTNLRVLLITTRIEDLPRHITHLLCVDECRVVAAGLKAEVFDRKEGVKHVKTVKGVKTVNVSKRPDRALRMANGSLPIGNRLRDNRALKSRATGRKAQPGVKLIELHNVTVRYGKSVVLHQVNWTVCEGESWALLGPNGSGKTTLLSLIQGDHPQAYTNEVIIFGQRRGSGESVWQLKKHIGWVSPELQLHFDDTVSVLEVVVSGFQDTIGLFQTPTACQSAAARRWLRHFGLIASAELPLFSLSAGLQRMSLLARALVKKPRLLILDEPCQGLDPAHRELILRKVDELIRSSAVTAIFVTHRPEEIPSSVKRVLRLARKD